MWKAVYRNVHLPWRALVVVAIYSLAMLAAFALCHRIGLGIWIEGVIVGLNAGGTLFLYTQMLARFGRPYLRELVHLRDLQVESNLR